MSTKAVDLPTRELSMPLSRIIQGLGEFQTNYFNTHQELFQQLSQGQTPDILLITCSDSRIDPNLLTQTQPGELFIIRNIGNIVPPHGILNSSEGAGIEYAVAALDIKHVVVCGHSHCGSMKALLQLNKLNEEMPLVYDWLKHHGEPVRRLLKENYGNCSEEQLLKIAIEENVLTQIENLETYPVIRSKMHSGQISLHAWVYTIETGKIYAYDANKGEFALLSSGPFPVPNPLSIIHHQQA
ncbi:Carbonate dehydratase [Stanieria cyanosphaera PCC 7437]|uniref:Carbonic anhydrase n=1 Tax=Stanieria cyanosphaera (strain ATCC 29371 / PCC 7437) TaxID=111780 RepID=K9XQG2_STAC7|nr:Carbonate dehydratase [Stanieria cyanosphaera PCC 7437]